MCVPDFGQKLVFVLGAVYTSGGYGPTVRDMDKCHKTDPLSWGRSSKRAHNIGRLREFFSEIAKTPLKWHKINFYG